MNRVTLTGADETPGSGGDKSGSTPEQTPALTQRQREVARHALGFDGRHFVSYRNHFVTGPDSVDYPVWTALVDAGLAHQRRGSVISGGDPIFWCTRRLALAVIEKDELLAADFGE